MLSKGLAYEKIALKFLLKKGLKKIQTNYHTRFGEIDLIMRDDNTIVFVEVRYRSRDFFGSAEESINSSKQRKIIKSAQFYLNQYKLWENDIRFDVITITPSKLNCTSDKINWYESAFTPEN